jgi:hypothetical protein
LRETEKKEKERENEWKPFENWKPFKKFNPADG